MANFSPLHHRQRCTQRQDFKPRLLRDQQHELRVDYSLRHTQSQLGMIPTVVQIPDPRVDSSIFRLDYQIEHDTLKPVPAMSFASFDEKLRGLESSLSTIKSQYDEFKASQTSASAPVQE